MAEVVPEEKIAAPAMEAAVPEAVASEPISVGEETLESLPQEAAAASSAIPEEPISQDDIKTVEIALPVIATVPAFATLRPEAVSQIEPAKAEMVLLVAAEAAPLAMTPAIASVEAPVLEAVPQTAGNVSLESIMPEATAPPAQAAETAPLAMTPAIKSIEAPVMEPAPQTAGNVGLESIKPDATAPARPAVEAPAALDAAASKAEIPGTDGAPSGSWLQLAGLQDYKAAAGRAMQPVAPEPKILMPEAGPRITLPGPSLPPELNSLQKANVTALPNHEARPKQGLPGWAVSLLFVIGIPALGAAVLFYFMPLGRSNAETKPVTPEVPVSVVQASSHPLAQFIEVTGFRFILDLNKKSEIHYLVVNHSAAELADMTVYVTLRAADAKPGQPPVCRFSFRAPTLSAFESKEMTSPIEKLSHPVALPEWQELRPEVQIAQ
jgi:hypothetical protein